jgi:hypothetical protein
MTAEPELQKDIELIRAELKGMEEHVRAAQNVLNEN